MKTKTVQARHLRAGDEIVDGGDGVRRTTHRVNEVHRDRQNVTVILRGSGSQFDRRPYLPRDRVRIKQQESA